MWDYFMAFLAQEERERTRRLSTLNELEELCLSEYADVAAIAAADFRLTYAEMFASVARMRSALAERGLKKGDTVAISLSDGADCVMSFLAVATSGMVAAVLPALSKSPALDGMMRLTGAVALISERDECGIDCLSPSDLRSGAPAPAAPVSPDDPAAAFFTGGTGGRPKSALLTHKALMTGAYCGIFAPNGAYFQRYYAVLPLHHVFGMIRNTLTCLQTGSTLYLCPDKSRMVQDFRAYKPTLLVLVPALADMLLGLIEMYGFDMIGGALKTIIIGAAPVPHRIVAGFAGYGVTVCPGYGLTETANLVSGNGHALERVNSVGKIYPMQQIRFVDGEIQLRGDNLFTKYINNDSETEAAFSDGWLRTGDLGYMDSDGFLYVTGRIKNLIVLPNGEKISPEAIESQVDALKSVKCSLVKMIKSDTSADMLSCSVLPVANADIPELRRLLDGLNAELPAYSKIGEFIIRDTDFKRTPAMKIARDQ